jgi:glycosyltransferase involved in cell wall biosynthesis
VSSAVQKKVLVASHSYSGNGAAVMLLALVGHWVRDLGWIVDVLLDIESDVPPDLAKIGVNIFSTAVPEDYDFALVNTLVSGHFLEMLGPRVPTVLWVHEGATILWGSKMVPVQWRELFGLAKRIIFQGPWQSETVFRSFLFPLSAGTVKCVRNGLPSLPENLVAKEKTDGKTRIVFVGGVYGRKRPHDLVDAVLRLNRKDIECVFVGSTEAINSIGPENVQRLEARPDCFTLVGELERKETLEYLSSADVFCLPSGDESQPIAPLEAASLGVPCLLSDLPPYDGTWKHEENCLLNHIGDIEKLQDNLTTLLENLAMRNRVIAGGRTVVEQYSMREFFQRFDAELP